VGRPTGLIAYDTHLNVAKRQRGEEAVLRLIRPRTVLYAALMLFVGAIMSYALLTRSTVDVNVIRDRSPPFVRLADGTIRNDYQLKLMNMAAAHRRFRIEVSGLPGVHFIANGHGIETDGAIVAEAPADSVANVRVHVVAPSGAPPGSHAIRFRVTDTQTGETAASASAFYAGARR
jgi:polyferredoxin